VELAPGAVGLVGAVVCGAQESPWHDEESPHPETIPAAGRSSERQGGIQRRLSMSDGTSGGKRRQLVATGNPPSVRCLRVLAAGQTRLETRTPKCFHSCCGRGSLSLHARDRARSSWTADVDNSPSVCEGSNTQPPTNTTCGVNRQS
jgi:hypothetical protein